MAHAHPDDCPECKGRGYFLSDNGPAPTEWACDECGGTGEYVWAGVIEAGLVRQRDEAEALLDSPIGGLRAWGANEAMRLSPEIRALRSEGYDA